MTSRGFSGGAVVDNLSACQVVVSSLGVDEHPVFVNTVSLVERNHEGSVNSAQCHGGPEVIRLRRTVQVERVDRALTLRGVSVRVVETRQSGNQNHGVQSDFFRAVLDGEFANVSNVGSDGSQGYALNGVRHNQRLLNEIDGLEISTVFGIDQRDQVISGHAFSNG